MKLRKGQKILLVAIVVFIVAVIAIHLIFQPDYHLFSGAELSK